MTNYAMIYNPKDGLKTAIWEGDSYEFLSSSVDGYIEHLCVRDFGDDIDVWINEEGKFREDLEQSAWLMYNGKPYDFVTGNLVFTRVDNEGETISLTEEDMALIKDYFDKATYKSGVYGMDLGSLNMVPCLHY